MRLTLLFPKRPVELKQSVSVKQDDTAIEVSIDVPLGLHSSDLHRLFQVEQAINELTGARLHIGLTDVVEQVAVKALQ